MTLQLEWTVVGLKPTRDLLELFGFDSHYYVMHIGIDNAVNGHGQRAVEAVRLYLEQVRASGGGEEAVQHQWRRIWNGFIAFGNLGTFFPDLADPITNRPSLRDRLVAMIAAKGEYGKFNHDQHRLGPNLINEWFADPDAMLDALVKFGKLKPGDWKGSPMVQLTGFATGPMYRVFSEDELQLWAEYTRSLAAPPAPQPQPGPSPGPSPQADPARAMAQVIDLLRPQQSGTAGHQNEQLNDADGTPHPGGVVVHPADQGFYGGACGPRQWLDHPRQPRRQPVHDRARRFEQYDGLGVCPASTGRQRNLPRCGAQLDRRGLPVATGDTVYR
jgi:hypothetical protein